MDDTPSSGVSTLLTPTKLAERWGCSTGWLANMRSAGGGPKFLKLGSNVRYRVPDVLEYENSHYSSV